MQILCHLRRVTAGALHFLRRVTAGAGHVAVATGCGELRLRTSSRSLASPLLTY
jgi:hypothetical protein